MMNRSLNTHTLKANLKNIKIIQGLQCTHAEVFSAVERIKLLAEQAYKITLLSELSTVIKNTKKVLSLSEVDSYANCQIYVIQVNRLIDSIAAIESQLTARLNGDSNDILLSFKEATRDIGAVFG